MDNKSPEAFRTISEVAEWLGVPAHVLRFWESRFGQVKPVKRAGGRRYYRPSDMELLGGIRRLLHEDGLTIRGVQKLLREKGVKYVAAMSPPIDQPAELREVVEARAAAESETASGADAGETKPSAEPEIEDAVELAPEATAPSEEAAPAPTVEDEAADMPVAEPTVTVETPSLEPEEPAEAAPPTAASEGETAPVDDAVETADVASESVEGPATVSEDSPLDGPEAIDFFAHEAEPDTAEGDDDAADNLFADTEDDTDAHDADEIAASEGQDTADTAPVAFAPQPVAPTPFEIDTAASGAAPEPAPTLSSETPPLTPEPTGEPGAGPLAEPSTPQPEPPAEAASGAAEPAADDVDLDQGAVADPVVPLDTPPSPAPDTAAPEPAAADAAPARATRGRDLAMPEIGPDPEDDADITLPHAVAAELRRHRAGSGGTRLNPALLQAYADRLETLSGRLGHASDTRRPF